MKSTGIVRKVDTLGRIVVPKELRDDKQISVGDAVEIFTEGNYVILRKYSPACLLCGEASDVIYYQGRPFCKACVDGLIKHFG